MIPQSLLKENIPFLITVFYYLYPKHKRLYFYTCFALLFGLIVSLFWGNVVFIDGSWRNWYSPFQYLSFMLSIIVVAYHRSWDIGFSTVLGFNSGSMVGYLYEAPRYFVLQGLKGLIRFNQYSLFHVSYGVLSVLVCAALLWKKIDLKPYLLLYLLYFFIFVALYDPIYLLKYDLAFISNLRVPRICLIRTPVMLLCLYLVYSLEKQIMSPHRANHMPCQSPC